MTIQLHDIYLPSDKIVARKIEQDLIIVPIQAGVTDVEDAMYSLNETGLIIWEKLGPGKTVLDLCSELADAFNAELETIQADVTQLLEQLLERQIIQKAQ